MKNRKLSYIILDDIVFKYYLDLKDRKNLNIRIKANNVLLISKPKHFSVFNLEKYLHDNKEIIIKKSLEITKINKQRIDYINDKYVVIFDKKYDTNENIINNLNMILFNYLNEIRSEFDKLIKNDIKIEVRDMSNKWGVAYIKKDLIIINSKLVHYPQECIKYVLLHEYMHFIEANHSKRFYKLIENIMPNYKKQIQYLKNN